MDGYTPFDVLMHIGWISLLIISGNLMRRFIPWFQKLLIPTPITAGLLGLLLGPNALGIIQFGEHFGDYATILIAAVFGALPFTMDFDAKVRQRARTMWFYSVGMFSAIVGGVIFARWGSKKGHTNEPALDKLPSDMRTGIISPRYSRRQACEHLIPVIIASHASS